ncbi:MAG: hypothetical protein AABX00_01495, partial [Nanoarchaeota archaeon]
CFYLKETPPFRVREEVILTGKCIDSACGDITLGRGYVIDFAMFSLSHLIITFVVIFLIVYTVWSIFRRMHSA